MTIPEGSSRVCGFIECEACRSKPGSPVLCEECLRRRMAFEATMNESKDHWLLILVLMLCAALWVLIIIGAITVVGWMS